MRGLDPRIHLLPKDDCSCKEDGLPGQVYDRAGQGRTRLPGNDDAEKRMDEPNMAQ
jgi:hypothetical protein